MHHAQHLSLLLTSKDDCEYECQGKCVTDLSDCGALFDQTVDLQKIVASLNGEQQKVCNN